MVFHIGIFLCTPVFADNTCDVLVGDKVQLSDIDAVLDVTNSFSKDEFETSQQFEDRVKGEVEDNLSQTLFLQTAFDQDEARYNADISSWQFTEYFPSNTRWRFDEDAIEEGGLADVGPFASVMLLAVDDVVLTYQAGNAIRVGIIEIARGAPMRRFRSKVDLFDLPDSVSYRIDGIDRDYSAAAISLPMNVDEARAMKGKFKFAVQANLVEPFVLKSTEYIPRPTGVTVSSTYLVADIQCGYVTDLNDNVLAIMPMAEPF